nr:PRELI domain-containing protein 1, mitochondrial [Megalopta genalis]XP_033342897.1 PRELI domain-containing protein 1, mitochondrial [Megalopta genalis]XP_033342906.1 PRELI domain-containing protein 1, mitochondrial [Megalopta genalis]XP_033342916.1 PRELI domain-containing protein 1, mitochondrial [Megalopta genalis]XP_033342925.1 PRELI domain-containing protein 1, mitochondrial [Megalopta genalis]XP_033342933.1 PRELI domain-containing protein 1, mitochondrial [Megalopta genalis]XP_03334294
MVKRYEHSKIFQFDWNQVALAFWHRYPNPHSVHVLSEDIISREVRDGVLYTKRLVTKKVSWLPKWGERLAGKNAITKVVEESAVDPHTKIMTTYTRNLSSAKLITIVEKVAYRVCEDNPNWTIANRSAWIDSKMFGGGSLQAYGLELLSKGFKRMFDGFEYVLVNMFPHTAQHMNPTVSQMGIVHRHDDGAANKSSLAGDLQHSLQGKAEKVKDVAKKATDLAKKKAGPFYAAYQPQQS